MDEDENELPDYEEEIKFDDQDENQKLVEVSEKTKEFLEECCGRSLTNTNRIKRRSHFPLPKVAATKTPLLDVFMKTEVSSSTKTLDKDLAKNPEFCFRFLGAIYCSGGVRQSGRFAFAPRGDDCCKNSHTTNWQR